jgi:hypothetical protein
MFAHNSGRTSNSNACTILVEVNCPLVGEGANDHSSDVGGAYNQWSDVGGEVAILKHVNFE